MKTLAIIQLILVVVQVWVLVTYWRAVKRAQRGSQSPPDPFKLDGCNCPPHLAGENYHYRNCPWTM